jgi:hypothetical protein
VVRPEIDLEGCEVDLETVECEYEWPRMDLEHRGVDFFKA